jgi:hypothetical protein
MTSTAEIARPTIVVSRSAPHYFTARLLGTLGMIGAPFFLILTICFALLGRSLEQPDRLMGAMFLVYMLGWVSSAAGMRRLRAGGDGLLGRAVLAVQWIGQMLALAWAVMLIVSPSGWQETRAFAILDASWPGSHAYMLLVGITTAVAGVWAGWRRWVPLACGLVVPVSGLVAQIAPGRNAWVFAAWTAVTWSLLGYAVRTGGGTSRR